jgi:hypothetical protein
MEWLISFLQVWWNGMGLELQIFYAIGLISSLIILIQVLLMFLGIGADMDVDDFSGADGGDPSDGLHLLSVRTITAFFMGFGWTGVIALRNSYILEIALIFAIFAGLTFMAVIFYLLKSLHSLRESGTLDYQNAIGSMGVVYTSIPANESGSGQVEITIQGRLCCVHAYTTSVEKLLSKSRVKVIDIVDPQTLLVEPITRKTDDVTVV